MQTVYLLAACMFAACMFAACMYAAGMFAACMFTLAGTVIVLTKVDDDSVWGCGRVNRFKATKASANPILFDKDARGSAHQPLVPLERHHWTRGGDSSPVAIGGGCWVVRVNQTITRTTFHLVVGI